MHLMLDFSYNLDSVFSHELCKSAFSDGIFWDSGVEPHFKNGRQLAAWLGLTPSQYSSGGKSKLGRITKAGDAYLRTLLVQGARSVMVGAENRTDPFSRWVCSLIGRRGYWRAVVAIAAKNARLCWASLHYGDDFRLYSTT